ncbi:MAG: DUF4445 domain-containing protein [Clostridia bacterium]|nr:DUF4445 domain-containing protein [Clostridia bacterium]
MAELTIIQSGTERRHSFAPPILLSDALSSFGYAVPHPCGGRGTCGKCKVQVNGVSALACRTTLFEDAEVILPEKEEIVSVTGAEESGQMTGQVCFCLDIGTTTLALALVSLGEGRIIRSTTAPNPQRAFGADVISRIDSCTRNGSEDLQRVLLEKVQEMISGLLSAFSLPFVDTLYAAGNTTMLHLFFGVDCSSMGVSPYTPAFLDQRSVCGKALGLFGVKSVVSLPGIAAFVGADIVSGIRYVGMPEKGEHSILLDLGTNAEIALLSEDRILCTAAAAGPCFEGANISCGMSASPGAVCAVTADGACTVIGGGEAKGLCATGLIDAVAMGVRKEIIDETGYLEDETMEICPGVVLTQKDVREFQLAKSAIRAGVECLIRQAGVSFADISHFYVAGGFSAGLNVHNAAFIGLIPDELKGKFVGVNNASLLGCVRHACSPETCAIPLSRAHYADLSSDPLFTQLFMEYMMF